MRGGGFRAEAEGSAGTWKEKEGPSPKHSARSPGAAGRGCPESVAKKRQPPISRRCSTKSEPSASRRDREDRSAACGKRVKSARPLRPGPSGVALSAFSPHPSYSPSPSLSLSTPLPPPAKVKSGRNAGGRKGKEQERNKESRPQGRPKTGGKASLGKPNAQTSHSSHFGIPDRGPRPSNFGIIRVDHYPKIICPLNKQSARPNAAPRAHCAPPPPGLASRRPRRSEADKKRRRSALSRRPFPSTSEPSA